MIIRNSKFKQVIPDNFTYKGTKYTKAYAKGKQLFGYSDDDYKLQYFTIESLEDGNVITLTIPAALTTSDMTDISYSTDNGTTWNTTTIDGTAKTISVSLDTGDKVIWKGNGIRLTQNSTWNSSKFNASKQHNVYGNTMSLLYGDNFSTQTTIQSRAFANLFNTNTKLIDASKLILPADYLPQRCYAQMFSGCTSLVGAPELPAITIRGLQVYSGMFNGCTSLVEAPELPATTLGSSCYSGMFNGCTSLTEAPELPAQTLTQTCYGSMFYGCTSLTEAPKLHATTLAQACYQYMFYGCSSLTEAPELPAPILLQQCYQNMFYGCTNLNYIKCLATDISATDCTTNWVNNVASTGTFIKADTMNDWTIDSVNGIPIGWTVHDYAIDYEREYFTIESLEDGNVITLTIGSGVTSTQMTSFSYSVDNGATWNTTTVDSTTQTINVSLDKGEKVLWKGVGNTTSAAGNTSGSSIFSSTKKHVVYGNIMSLLFGDSFINETSLANKSTRTFGHLFNNNTNIVEAHNLALPATTLQTNCYQIMFEGCTSLTTAPKLPATTTAQYCYQRMFRNTALVEAPELPATTLSTRCYYDMFFGCTSLTTSPDLPNATLAYQCCQEMFYGCTSLTKAPKLPSTTLAAECYRDMFLGCSSLTEAPELPAQTLTSGCYRGMFNSCSSLNYIKCLATDISAADCTTGWVSYVAATGTFVKADEMDDWVVDSVNGIPIGWTDHGSEDYSSQYFTIESLEDDNTFQIYHGQYANAPITIEYSLNNGSTWTSKTYQTNTGFAVQLNLNKGDKVLVKSSNIGFNTSSVTFLGNANSFFGNKAFKVYGNVMSLIYGDDFANQTTIPYSGALAGLFMTSENLNDASNLVLPATNVSAYCYYCMFYGCSSLKKGPSLPATSLGNCCYQGMFAYCKSLTEAPALPSGGMKLGCYNTMFKGCTSLVTPPALPAENLRNADGCYKGMFYGCTALTSAPALPATVLSVGCYQSMFQNCTSLATAPELPSETILEFCYKNMFWNCNKIVGTFSLPALTVGEKSYDQMFTGTKITTIKVYAPSSSWAIDFGSSLPSSGTYYVKRNATSNVTVALPSGWRISKTL